MNAMEQTRNRRDGTLDMLTGCWNRLHVSNDRSELVRLVAAAKGYIKELATRQAEYAGLLTENGIKLSNRPCKDEADFDELKIAVKSAGYDDAINVFCEKLRHAVDSQFVARTQKIMEHKSWYDQYE